MNNKYILLSVVAVSTIFSVNLLADQALDEGRLSSDKPGMRNAEHHEAMMERRQEMREQLKAEWKKIAELPPEEQAVVIEELKEKINQIRKERRKQMSEMRERRGDKKCVDGDGEFCPKGKFADTDQAKRNRREKDGKGQAENKNMRKRPSQDQMNARKEKFEQRIAEIKEKIAQLPPEQQKEAQARLERKLQQRRQKAAKGKNKKRVTEEQVNKLIDNL